MATNVATRDFRESLQRYLQDAGRQPLFLCGNAKDVLSVLPPDSFDFCMTSPPYWNKRQYAAGGIGLEEDYRQYIENLMQVFAEVHRVLKETGSFWLNIGDTYLDKRLLCIPWRVSIEMSERQGWILRNEVVWNKVKGGPDNSIDKLRNVHEPVFHFVKRASGYFYNADAVRTPARKARVLNGSVISATGVRGVRYRRQIELSSVLTQHEKACAMEELDKMLDAIRAGHIADFRMIIRGQQRTTHSNSEKVSGRARDLVQKGFYFLRYHPNGSKPSDVWDIVPEDTQNRGDHFAPYPEDLCRIPIAATCPDNGLVLDPFCGTGTTNLVAFEMGRKSVGVDLSPDYVRTAMMRCQRLL